MSLHVVDPVLAARVAAVDEWQAGAVIQDRFGLRWRTVNGGPGDEVEFDPVDADDISHGDLVMPLHKTADLTNPSNATVTGWTSDGTSPGVGVTFDDGTGVFTFGRGLFTATLVAELVVSGDATFDAVHGVEVRLGLPGAAYTHSERFTVEAGQTYRRVLNAISLLANGGSGPLTNVNVVGRTAGTVKLAGGSGHTTLEIHKIG